MGYSTDEMVKLFGYFSKNVMAVSPKGIIDGIKEIRGIKIGGITSGRNIESIIKEAADLKKIKNIQDIKMPIVIPTTDLISDSEIVFTNSNNLEGDKYIHDIEISKAVRASSSFSGIYAPFEYKKYQFVDGGIFNNLPVADTKKTGVDKIISVIFNIKNKKKQNTLNNIVMQSLDLMTDNLIKPSIKESDYVIEIDLKDVKPFSLQKIDFAYQQGYLQTLDHIKKIKTILS